MPKLTFTAYDITLTKAADQLAWRIQHIVGPAKMQKTQGVTTINGSPEKPMLEGSEFVAGTYELHLDVESYFKQQGWELPEPAVLQEITLRFHLQDIEADYNLHIQLTPHSYNFTIERTGEKMGEKTEV